MRVWLSRLLAVMFAASLLISPQAAVFAVDDLSRDNDPNPELVDDATADDQSSDSQSGNAPDQTDANPGDGEGEPSGEGDNAAEGSSDDPAGDNESSDAGNGDAADTPGSLEGGDSESVDGTPGSEEPEDSGDTDANLPDDDGESNTVDDDNAENGDDSLAAPASVVGPTARITDDWTLYAPTYDPDTGILAFQISLNTGFNAVSGDYLEIRVSDGFDADLTLLSVSEHDRDDLIEVVLSGTVFNIRVTFKQDYSVISGTLNLKMEFATTLTWDACDPHEMNSYQQRARIYVSDKIGAGGQQRSIEIDGPTCEGHGGPHVNWVTFSPITNELAITLAFPDTGYLGKSATITYPPEQLYIAPGTYPIDVFSITYGSYIQGGTAVVTEGLITLSIDHDDPDDEISNVTPILIPAMMITEACEPGSAVVTVDPIYYLATPGGGFEDEFGDVLCDAAPMTKTGTWISDTEIEWTIDSGDLYGHAYVRDTWHNRMMNLDCDDTDAMSIEYVSGYDEPDAPASFSYCRGNGFEIYLDGDIVHRVMITFRTTVDTDDSWTSYLNCADSYTVLSLEPFSVQQVENLGFGGKACYELFPEDTTGDILSKTVDRSEVESGETVTYTVKVSTASDSWRSITVTDALPEGFEIDESSIECSVLPAHHESDPCYTLVDNTLTVVAEQVLTEGWEPNVSDPVDISVTFSGTITGDPGDVIANEACSERIYEDQTVSPLAVVGDPTIPGGGVICETASVTIVGDDDDETPSPSPSPTPTGTVVPSPTPDPATPGATPTAPADPDPTATSPVTGLPKTGQTGGGTVSAAFIAAIAASLLMATAVGIRLRPRE